MGALHDRCYPPGTALLVSATNPKTMPACVHVPLPRGSARRNHDQQLHQALVDVASGGGLEDEDILVADRLADGEGGLLV